MKNKSIQGGCICGEVKYKLSETPLFTQACHCKDCKILTGSSYVINSSILENTLSIEGEISKCSEKFSDQHFQEREIGKNISAMASNQSEEIESYEILMEKYDAIKAKVDAGEIQENRPSDWGGFQVKINYFEFWEAFEDRLNYRECYKKESDSWRKFFLQS